MVDYFWLVYGSMAETKDRDIISQDDFNKLTNEHLNPKTIDSTNFDSSFYKEVVSSNQINSNKQVKLFKLDSMTTYSDGEEAAAHLLKREYGYSHLFENNNNEAIFIPPEFTAGQYSAQTGVAVLDYDICNTIETTLDNLKNHSKDFWFTQELEEFVKSQTRVYEEISCDNDNKKVKVEKIEIQNTQYLDWILRMKAMFIIWKKSDGATNLPKINNEDDIRTQLDWKGNTSAHSKEIKKWVETEFKKINNQAVKTKKNQKAKPKQTKPREVEDPILEWFFQLEITGSSGDKTEHELFNKLKDLRKTLLKDMVVLYSCDFFTDGLHNKHQEIDFLIFSASRKLIISIESKRSLIRTKAFTQLDKYFKLLEKLFGHYLPDWTYFPIIHAGEKLKFKISSNELSFITPETDVQNWLEQILGKYPEKPDLLLASKDSLKKVIEILIFAIHVSKSNLPPVTTTSWDSYIDRAIKAICTKSNIIFYSKNQLPIFSGPPSSKYKRVYILGVFGSGKSVLLNEKAELMCTLGYHVYYIMDGVNAFPCTKLLESSLRRKFQDFKVKDGGFIEVVSQHDNVKMKEILESNSPKVTILWDEFYTHELDNETIRQPEAMLNLKAMAEKDWVIWISQKVGSKLPDGDIKDILENKFHCLQLAHNMRNTKQIIKVTQEWDRTQEKEQPHIQKMQPLQIHPEGRGLQTYDDLVEAIQAALKVADFGVLIIYKYRQEVGDNYNRLQQVFQDKLMVYSPTLKESCGPENDAFEHLKGKGNVLVTSYSICEGFEWDTNVVVIGGSTYYNEFRFLRCTKNLFCVK